MNDAVSEVLATLATQLTTIASRLADLAHPTDIQADQQAEDTVRRGYCLWCGERFDDRRTMRGVHERCYRLIKRAIDRNEIGEAELVRAGQILPARPGRTAAKLRKLDQVRRKIRQEPVSPGPAFPPPAEYEANKSAALDRLTSPARDKVSPTS